MTVEKSFAVLTLLAMLGACSHEVGRESADLVLLHGKIVTMDDDHPEVEALAAKGDTIVAVGSDEQIESYIGSDTRAIDLEGRLAVPGLIEGHGHFMSFGASLMELDLKHARTWNEKFTRISTSKCPWPSATSTM